MKKLIVIIGVIAALIAPLVVTSNVSAQSVDIYGACSGSSGEVCKNRGATVQPLFKNLINAILLILGAISVIMIIIGGFQYVTSAGDSNKVKTAKSTIMYAVIGVAVALLSYAIVDFVFGKI